MGFVSGLRPSLRIWECLSVRFWLHCYFYFLLMILLNLLTLFLYTDDISGLAFGIDSTQICDRANILLDELSQWLMVAIFTLILQYSNFFYLSQPSNNIDVNDNLNGGALKRQNSINLLYLLWMRHLAGPLVLNTSCYPIWNLKTVLDHRCLVTFYYGQV